MKPKIIAMYLPQFHEIPENDEWWGKGYTEWDAVKEANSYFNNHRQPRIPLNNYYYNLLDKSTMQWQAELMQKYNIYGMCFYHYYFSNGRKVLEKPAENLLKWKDINMSFCFSWANETWARSWSKITSKNTWNNKREGEEKKEVLIRQEYGGEADWRKHFDYLVPFFMDSRYIKLGNKPIFIIHNPEDISCLTSMLEKWNDWIAEIGYDGIYFVGRNSNADVLNAIIQQEPNYSDLFISMKNKSYDLISEMIIANAYLADDNKLLCATPGYDDTPRRGIEGEIIYDSSPQKFFEQLRAVLLFASERNHEFIFINAWNEWGEGMYLEPDTEYKYGYLESVLKAQEEPFAKKEIEMIRNKACLGIKHEVEIQKDKYMKMKSIYETLESMLCAYENDYSIAKKLLSLGLKKVGIMGLGKIGKHLVHELEKDGFKISYGIDRYANGETFLFPVYQDFNNLPDTDAVILTVNDNSLKKTLEVSLKYPIIPIWDIL